VSDLLSEAAALFDDELRPEVDDLRADIQERTEALEAFLRDECLAPLGEECDTFAGRLDEFQAELAAAVEHAIERNAQSVREALDACREQFESEIEELLEACATAMGVIDEAFETVTEGTSEVLRMGNATAELHDEHTRGFDGIRETLDHVRETFGRFSFLG
jgi:chromosome segregation ATPase